jgi:hypothetical protein
MGYEIQYFKGAVRVGSAQQSGSLEETRQVARRGLIRHGGDFFRIIDDNTGVEVDSGRHDDPKT